VRHFRVFLLFIFWVLGTFGLSAQNPIFSPSWRCQIIPFSETKITLDTLSIVPKSIYIRQVFPKSSIPPDFYYNLNNNQLKFINNSKFIFDSLEICYRVFPFLLSDTLQNRQKSDFPDSLNYTSENIQEQIALTEISSEREAIFSDSALQTSGNITQGISVGNAQNAQVNSSINLQLNGKVTEDMELKVTLTDQNVPFQPEGNTQNIQDFDRILVQAKHTYFTAKAGDIILKNSDSYFLKYYKNVQGASLETKYAFLKDTLSFFGEKVPQQMQTKFGISEAKGQFHSEIVEVYEGIQGPYRLRGPSGERFIIILAGSEKVFADGQLLTRGFDHDYMIDYNTAEIIFTNNLVITEYTRIRVDFEYANQNFNRSILAFEHQQQLGKLGISAHFYQEKDDPNSESARLTTDDIQVMRLIGDNLKNAIGTTEQPAESYSNNLILYKKKDTLILNHKYENIYIRTTNPNDEIFTVGFSEVGQNKGNYILDNSTANGKVFQWVAPVDGTPQGNYEPIRNLPAPTLKKMWEFGTIYQLSKQENLFLNLGLSEQDKNLFSKLQNYDNQGFAIKIGYEAKEKEVLFLKNYKRSNLLSLEFNETNFQPIDRFRPIEFDRNWSIQSDSSAQDFILKMGIGLKKDEKNQFDYLLSYRNRIEQAKGFQHQLNLYKKWYFFTIKTNLFLLHSTSKSTISDWQRITGEIFYNTKLFRQGYQFSTDKNTLRNIATDSIVGTAMFFDQHLIYFENLDSAKTQFRLDYSFREDQIPVNGRMTKNTEIQAVNFSTKGNYKHQNLSWKVTYRTLKNLQNPTLANEETLLNNFQYSFKLYKNSIRSEIGLVNATGRELQREFQFLEVANGQGTHTWRDENEDKVQDLGEFYEAINPDEKNYVKIFTPTDNYTSAYTANFAYRLTLKPPQNWKKETGLKKQLFNFEANSAWTLERKITTSDFLPRFIPFLNNLPFEKILSKREILRGTLFYKRTSRKYGSEFSFRISESQMLLTQGFEARKNQEFKWQIRYHYQKKQSLRLLISREEKSNASDFLETQNYQILAWQFSPSWVWQPSRFFRLEGYYFLKIKQNTPENQNLEQAKIHEFQLNTRLAKAQKRNVSANFRGIFISYDGIANSPVGYQILEALQVGQNYNLSINWQERLRNGLQLTFQYNGRKSEGKKVVHWGNVRASFLF